jgi:hypothetical protein
MQVRIIAPDSTRPQRFPAKFMPRSNRIAEILQAEARIAREDLRIYYGETRLRFEDSVVS